MANSYIKKINGYFVKDEEARHKISTLEESVSLLREDLDSTDSSLETAKDAIEQLQSDYNTTRESLYTIGHKADDAYDLADSANTAAGNAQDRADQAYSLAEGRGVAHVFDTDEAMTTALKGASNTAYRIGEQLLIKEADVPDYWVSGIKDNNNGTYGYYEITILETQKVDLSGYATKESLKNYATTSGTFPSMKVGSATTADKVAKALKIQLVSGVTPTQYDGSVEKTIGSQSTPIAYAGHATKADSADKDGSGNNIVGTYATKDYADAYNITFSVSDEELTIKKDGTKPFSA